MCTAPHIEGTDIQPLSNLAVYVYIKKSSPFDMTVKRKNSVITSGEL